MFTVLGYKLDYVNNMSTWYFSKVSMEKFAPLVGQGNECHDIDNQTLIIRHWASFMNEVYI